MEMDKEFAARLSNLGVIGYYDASCGMVIAYFYNPDENKKDIVAYLLKDMTWDVREIIDERVLVTKDQEIAYVSHEPLCKFKMGSNFDKFIRGAVEKSFVDRMGDEIDENTDLTKLEATFAIFENNRYPEQ